MHDAGLAGVVLGFGVATVLILVVGLVYATAIRALPRTGGGVLFALFSAGRIPGFIAGWSLALGYIGIGAMNASAVTLFFRVTFPGIPSHGKLFEIAGWEVYLAEVLVAILFIWVFALLNMKGVDFPERFQFWAVVTRLTCIAVLGVSAVYAFLTTDIELPAAVPRVSRC
ncbi:amino acid permease [Micrococcus luteus]|uniref:amino acid permease n=1 Tax=Micrococcus luteus TaxID=1270 RepID=UPI0036A1D2A4